jgi:DNA polymerase III epsilon subunit-like protein
MKQNLLIDIETLGTRAGCAILEIGAVAFDVDDEPEDWWTFDSGLIQLESCLGAGMHVDAETLRWWASRKAFWEMINGRLKLKGALEGLAEFGNLHLAPGGDLWCWGTSFDFPVLKDAFDRHSIEPKWMQYWNEKDARTLCKLVGVERRETAGFEVAHRALADAKAEADAVTRALAKLERLKYNDFRNDD